MDTVVNPQELVDTLKHQHLTLCTDLSAMLETGNDKAISSQKILDALSVFKSDLMEHLKLENMVFYPDYLDRKTKVRENTSSLHDFMDLMDEIAVAVTAFLGKYSTLETISASRTALVDELSSIIKVLNVRIKAEEEIFDTYLNMTRHSAGAKLV